MQAQKYDFEFASIKTVDILGRLKEKGHPASQITKDTYKNKQKCYKYFIDPFREISTLNIFAESPSHEVIRDVSRFLQARNIKINIKLRVEFFIFDSPNFMTLSSNPKSLEESENFSNILAEIVSHLEKIDINTISYYQGPAVNQSIIEFDFANLLDAINNLMVLKYITKQVVNSYGKTVTFMAMPLVNNSSSLGITIQLDGINSQDFCFGIRRNIQEIFAFTNPSQNSFKKLHKININNIDFIKLIDDNTIELNFVDCIGNLYFSIAVIIFVGINFNAPNANQYEQFNNKNLFFIDTLENSLKKLKHNIKFYANILNDQLVEEYLEAVKNLNDYCNNALINPADILTYYNM